MYPCCPNCGSYLNLKKYQGHGTGTKFILFLLLMIPIIGWFILIMALFAEQPTTFYLECDHFTCTGYKKEISREEAEELL